MLDFITNFFKTIYNQLIDFFKDLKIFFTDIFANIHNLLNKVLPDEVILLFLIAIIAFLAIFIFIKIINKD